MTADDCDDGDSGSTIVAEDGDCDGTLTADDCDDGMRLSMRTIRQHTFSNAMATVMMGMPDSTDDADNDTFSTCDGDCDDGDSNSTLVSEDADCDGTLTADDCDDGDSGSTIVAEDGDCDGTLTADDCDDGNDLAYDYNGASILCASDSCKRSDDGYSAGDGL